MRDTRETMQNFTFRVKPSELESWKRAAEVDGRTLSSWMRRQINLAAKPAG